RGPRPSTSSSRDSTSMSRSRRPIASALATTCASVSSTIFARTSSGFPTSSAEAWRSTRRAWMAALCLRRSGRSCPRRSRTSASLAWVFLVSTVAPVLIRCSRLISYASRYEGDRAGGCAQARRERQGGPDLPVLRPRERGLEEEVRRRAGELAGQPTGSQAARTQRSHQRLGAAGSADPSQGTGGGAADATIRVQQTLGQ